MKTLKFFMAAVVLMAVCAVSPAQTGAKTSGQTKTETIKVWGNCGMCKDRIEKAVTTEGATSAAWDSKTKMLTVSFDPAKTNVDALSKKLASVGHDTEKYKADSKVYDGLPGCCKYERTK
jgi:periplasmic mercuric ion binding protein